MLIMLLLHNLQCALKKSSISVEILLLNDSLNNLRIHLKIFKYFIGLMILW